MSRKNIIIGIITLVIVIGILYFIFPKNKEGLLGGRSGGSEPATQSVYLSTGHVQSVCSGPCRLERIIIAKDVATSSIRILDGSTEIAVFSGDTLHGTYEMGLDIVTSLVATITNSTNNLFVITPK
jgi:hypothetical protein